ncbi:MAG: hypothetical protein J6C23_04140 [Clostridia bacterium]|nr:hypothetical protein [Clostridia bacterium]
MKKYTVKTQTQSTAKFVADDMILTKDIPTCAGSKMLDGYVSLFEAEVLTRLADKGYGLAGKTDVGEFSIDLLGETSYNGAIIEDGVLKNATASVIKDGEVDFAITLDVNGSVRRAAAQDGLVSIKPTYGTVSRFGTIPVVCSGETVSVMAKTADLCKEALSAIAGHDDKDGTSLPQSEIDKTKTEKEIRKVAVLSSMLKGVDGKVSEKLNNVCEILRKNGIEVTEIDDSVIALSSAYWAVLMSAECCNNVSKYDGVKYGYRAQNFMGIDELYTNSRTEAFGFLLKSTILLGSETLSTANYVKIYDKALRMRRVIVEEFAKIFASYDVVLMPACSAFAYGEEDMKNTYKAYEENFYTAPASITGLPAVVVGGVQFVGNAFSENSMLSLAAIIEKEGK